MTNEQKTVLLGLFKELGVPLACAVQTARASEDIADEDIARSLAGLLNQSVALSGEISKSLELSADDQKLRIQSMSVAALLLSDSFQKNGELGNEQDLKASQEIVQTLISFADGFTSAVPSENAETALPDRVSIEAMKALTPLTIAASEFSFGENPNTLVGKLTQEFDKKLRKLYADFNVSDKNAELRLTLMTSAADILVTAYRLEVERFEESKSLDDALKAIWAKFDEQITLLEALIKFSHDAIFGSEDGTQDAGSSSDSKGMKPAPQQKNNKVSEGNPMSFFLKK